MGIKSSKAWEKYVTVISVSEFNPLVQVSVLFSSQPQTSSFQSPWQPQKERKLKSQLHILLQSCTNQIKPGNNNSMKAIWNSTVKKYALGLMILLITQYCYWYIMYTRNTSNDTSHSSQVRMLALAPSKLLEKLTNPKYTHPPNYFLPWYTDKAMFYHELATMIQTIQCYLMQRLKLVYLQSPTQKHWQFWDTLVKIPEVRH